MFGWFKKNEEGEFYRPKERKIYGYWDGQKDVREDPVVISRRMSDIGPELKIDLTVASSASKDAGKAELSAVKKLQGIFQIKSYAEGGLTEDELWELFSHFLDYRTNLKKNLNPSLTSAPETLASSSSSPVESRPTVSGLGCGSIVSEPCTAPAEPSPKPSPLDSACATQV